MTKIYNGNGSNTIHLGARVIELSDSELNELNEENVKLMAEMEAEIDRLYDIEYDLSKQIEEKDKAIMEQLCNMEKE